MKITEADLAYESWAYIYDIVCDFIDDWGSAAKVLALRVVKRERYQLLNGLLDGFASYIRRMAMMSLADRAEEFAQLKPTKKRKAGKRLARVLPAIDPENQLTWRNLHFDWQLPDQKCSAGKRTGNSPRAATPAQPPELYTTTRLARKFETICRVLRNHEAALRRLARKTFDRERWILKIAEPKNPWPHARVNNFGIDILFRRKFPHLLEKSKLDPG